MKRALILALAASAAFAQASREDYRRLYQDWRQTAPALEQEAAVAGPNFAGQVQNAAAAAKAYTDARAKFYAEGGSVTPDQAAWIGQPLQRGGALLETPQEIQQLVAVMAARVATNITSFAEDKDPAIRLVRQAMERERAALRALTESMNARKALLGQLTEAQDVADQQRSSVNEVVKSAAARRDALVAGVQREAAAWADYYKDLAESVNGPARPSQSAVQPSAVKPAPGPVVPGAMPLSRYTGEWLFPSRGLFYGPQPESVELMVREEGGELSGTLEARFADKTAVQLNFQGAIQPARNQTFPIQSADGTQGTIELIPGSAFNLIEINLQTSAKPAAANFILVRR